MAKQVQIRRDTAANLALVTPALGELIYDTTNERIGIGDGTSTADTEALYAVMAKDLHKLAPLAAEATHSTDGNDLSVVLDPAPSAYTTRMVVLLQATDDISGPATLDVGLGQKAIKKNHGADDLEEGDMVDGGIYMLSYDGTAFQLVGGGAGGGSLEAGTAVASTSGTTVSFTGLPAGLNRIMILIGGVGFSAGAAMTLVLGDSGGYETSGYQCQAGSVINGASSTVVAATASFRLHGGNADGSEVTFGTITLTRVDGNQWAMSAALAHSVVNYAVVAGGQKTLSGELDRLQLGGGTFDAGKVNILYE